ncbi:Fc.00g095500.m01.CDS01 [Cosmosporella sp. VM-42]
MDIAFKVIEHTTKVDKPSYIDNYLVITSLHDELLTWYNSLPAELAWNRRNFQEAPSSYFLLHRITFQKSPHSPAPAKSAWSFSLKACQSYAIQISHIFSYHQQRFHVRNISATGIQHAATAATALIGLIPLLDKPEDRGGARFHFLRLDQVLKANADIYAPAKRMHKVLDDAIQRCGLHNSDHTELEHNF